MTYKTYDNGDEWDAADFNAFMSQGIPRFADSTARSAAISSPATGQMSYVTGTGYQYWNGSAWTNLSTAGATGPAGAGASLGNFTTGGRPTASGNTGKHYYDTTLSKPAWSDGTNWRDAAGTTV